MRRTASERGFTLIELIVSIALLGIISMAAIPLMRLPMRAQLDASNRAELAAEVDAVATRLRADFAQALPHSVRIRQVGARWFVEYLEVRASGRYRNGSDGTPPVCPAACSGDQLQTMCSEGCFKTLGPLDGAAPVPGADFVVLPTTGSNPWFGGMASPAGSIKSRLLGLATAGTSQVVTMTPLSFPLATANQRFWIVSTPVTYECNPATRRLTRYSNYAITAVQPIAFAAAATAAPLAVRIGSCPLPSYVATGSTGGVLNLRMRHDITAPGSTIIESAESVLSFSLREEP